MSFQNDCSLICNNRTLIIATIAIVLINLIIFLNLNQPLIEKRQQLVTINDFDTEWPEITGLWFVPNGTIYPTPSTRRCIKLYPEESGSDRIVNQLMYVPTNYDPKTAPVKKILVPHEIKSWDHLSGNIFTGCPVNACRIYQHTEHANEMDAVILKQAEPDYQIELLNLQRSPRQIWILYFVEAPYHAPKIKYDWNFNWTATYRDDSDIVTPYNRWLYYDQRVKTLEQNRRRNFAANKTKKVAWLVSNCHPQNGRAKYAHELKKYIEVDIFGRCGDQKCPANEKCIDFISDNYKFYLAFENSNCKDYVTEKFFSNTIGKNIVPIVMGAKKTSYERYAPQNSFIHVEDFTSPKQLAAMLHVIDQNDTMYNEFFQWKGTGMLFPNLNLFFGCRLCALLHDNFRITKTYPDIKEWWSGNGICSRNFWP